MANDDDDDDVLPLLRVGLVPYFLRLLFSPPFFDGWGGAQREKRERNQRGSKNAVCVRVGSVSLSVCLNQSLFCIVWLIEVKNKRKKKK